MWARIASRFTYANVVATLALFAAVAGGAYAAFKLPKNSVGTKQLKNGAVTTKKLAKGAVTTKKLATGAVTTQQLANGAVTAANVAAANQDGSASTPSLRTLGTGATEAAAGNDPRFDTGKVIGTVSLDSTGPVCTFSVTKQSGSSLLLLTFAATGSDEQAPQLGGIALEAPGPQILARSKLWFNNNDEHLAFPAVTTSVSGLAAGAYTLTVKPYIEFTVMDANDNCYLTAVEVQQ